MNMVERDENGLFKEQLPNDWLFNKERGQEIADNYAWQNKRKQILKQYPNLWEEYKDQ